MPCLVLTNITIDLKYKMGSKFANYAVILFIIILQAPSPGSAVISSVLGDVLDQSPQTAW